MASNPVSTIKILFFKKHSADLYYCQHCCRYLGFPILLYVKDQPQPQDQPIYTCTINTTLSTLNLDNNIDK